MIGRLKCTIAVCRRTTKNDGRWTLWICGRCLKTVDKELRDDWKRRRQASRTFRRRWKAKSRPPPYPNRCANHRAYVALWIDANAGFLRCVQDARIKRAMEELSHG